MLVSRHHNQKYDSILIIVCCATKYTLFISTCEASTTIKFAELFFKHVECCFETLQGIVIDRDSQITSDFWREVCEIQIIKRCLLTAYHPQTDGQSKTLNQIVKDYLYAYTIEDSTVWACLLSLAQFAYNNSQSFSTNMSSN